MIFRFFSTTWRIRYGLYKIIILFLIYYVNFPHIRPQIFLCIGKFNGKIMKKKSFNLWRYFIVHISASIALINTNSFYRKGSWFISSVHIWFIFKCDLFYSVFACVSLESLWYECLYASLSYDETIIYTRYYHKQLKCVRHKSEMIKSN